MRGRPYPKSHRWQNFPESNPSPTSRKPARYCNHSGGAPFAARSVVRCPMINKVIVSILPVLCAIPAMCQVTERGGTVPIYRVTVVQRNVDAINYQYRALPTKVDFRGTVLMPKAKGEATVESKRGRT